MQASAHARIEHRHGRDVVVTRRAESPVSIRPSGGRVLLASTAAHPVGGDDIDVEIDVVEGARVSVGTVGATLVWPGPTGARSTMTTRCSVGRGAHLELAPEPTVAVAGADHRAVTRVVLDRDATCRVVEELTLGRTGEPSGTIELSVRVERAGQPLVHHDERFSGDLPPTSVSVGMARHVIATVVVGPLSGESRTLIDAEAAAAWLPLADDAAMAIAIGADRTAAQRAIGQVTPGCTL